MITLSIWGFAGVCSVSMILGFVLAAFFACGDDNRD